ncbi:hypothetical protein KC338_g3048 [Hortaea werneckii]|nr:hypothetical protein KC323_g3325 [Hortaea werneckii]KAI6870430.1 hypothetical protein KC338_g3048 [Hortaea werneckii]KAI7353407.1 hypothetical protein KC320_g3973 [Hortaea werneckii]
MSTNRPQFEYYVLNFFYDDSDSCALTVFVNNVRFHIIADKDELSNRSFRAEYARLISAVRKQAGEDIPQRSSDSGIDVSHDDKGDSESKEEGESEESEVDAETELHQWMLDPLETAFRKYAPHEKAQHQLTLEQWYNGPTHFYSLSASQKGLRAIELKSTTDLERRIKHLLHEIAVPKYIQNIKKPWYSAKDLTVLDGSNSPSPYHPAKVQTPEGQTYFLKLVDRDQPQPVKREIHLLDEIEKRGLHNHMKCPKLEGLVTMSGGQSKVMAFLQTHIPDPIPLTTKLDADVPQDLRDRWADESETVKELLHENGIVWGDAKADNFMVDTNNDLWIIDFGGSYTEGWVDPELKDTAEGDDQGVEKIANALHDPVANVWDPDTEKSFGGNGSSEGGREDESHSASRKRKAGEVSVEDEEGGSHSKRGRQSEQARAG